METFQPKSILCPTDFSEPATQALHYGKHLANCFDTRLLVLYAEPFSPPPYFTSGQVEELVKTIERFKGAAHEYLTRYVSEHIEDSSKVEMVDPYHCGHYLSDPVVSGIKSCGEPWSKTGGNCSGNLEEEVCQGRDQQGRI